MFPFKLSRIQAFSHCRKIHPQFVTFGFVILLSPLTILSSVSPLSSYSFQVPKECREHCESNRPPGEYGPFIFNCGSLQNAILSSPSDCDDTTCAMIQCPPEICTKGTVHCPAALESEGRGNLSHNDSSGGNSTGQGNGRFGNDGPGGLGGSDGIPAWFWILFGIIIFISICSVLCGFASRSYYGHGYGGHHHHHHHDDGCGGGHYHSHHHDGCGGGYGYGYGGSTIGYGASPMTYVSSSMTMPIHPAVSVQHVYRPQTHLY